MFRWKKCGLLAVTVGCAPAWSTPASQRTPDETAAFGAVVREFRARIGGELSVDPSPMDLSELRHYPSPDDYRGGNDVQMITVRNALLDSVGLRSSPIVPLLNNCTGVMAPPPDRKTSGCPQSPKVHIVIDLVGQGERDGSWSVRAFEINYTPAGRSGVLYDVRIVCGAICEVRSLNPVRFFD